MKRHQHNLINGIEHDTTREQNLGTEGFSAFIFQHVRQSRTKLGNEESTRGKEEEIATRTTGYFYGKTPSKLFPDFFPSTSQAVDSFGLTDSFRGTRGLPPVVRGVSRMSNPPLSRFLRGVVSC